ncbi:type I restriction endonuclease subunit R [Oscillatoria salina]|uniref:type I restriction endonuclease subunit R n=1 Tax=Oscillatoria salina TaxID=331517 RepID=UPI001CCDE6C8|nr:type I restriction endonuclease subunit R [Oscillatoria salina]MBZ8178535.1 type I restriction endonuclease subunit R [Oscillatoria salina IIICB1]
MVQVISAEDITLEEIQAQFQLQQATNADFFPEWQENLPSLTDTEKQALKRIKSNYFNLVSRRPLLEEAVKMVVLSPLLDLTGFYQLPFAIQTEAAVEITAKDEEAIVRGKIDVLVIQQRFWVLVIESTSTKFDVMEALPQALVYMLANLSKEKPRFGFLVNGREFVFVKVTGKDNLVYSRSYALSLERNNDLEQVLSVLKKISQLLRS